MLTQRDAARYYFFTFFGNGLAVHSSLLWKIYGSQYCKLACWKALFAYETLIGKYNN